MDNQIYITSIKYHFYRKYLNNNIALQFPKLKPKNTKKIVTTKIIYNKTHHVQLKSFTMYDNFTQTSIQMFITFC